MLNPALSISLCISSSLEAILIHFIQKNQVINVHSEQLIILSEILKIIVSLICFYKTKTNTERFNFINIEWFIIPSFIYMISNNLTYYALIYITPSLFNLLSNLKIPVTTFLAFFFLHKSSFNLNQLYAILFIFCGNVLAFCSNINLQNFNYIGLISMILYSLCSGIASVYSEYIMKFEFYDENVFLQNIKFSICSVVSNLLLSVLRRNILSWYIEPIHLLAISSMSINGLITGLVLKFQGSIIKTYATSLSVFISILISNLLWNYTISIFFIFGAIISFLGINIYIYDTYYRKDEYQIFLDDDDEF